MVVGKDRGHIASRERERGGRRGTGLSESLRGREKKLAEEACQGRGVGERVRWQKRHIASGGG